MELRLVGSGAPRLSSSAYYSSAQPVRRRRVQEQRRGLVVRSGGRGASTGGVGLQRSPKKELSMILRAEAAVLGVERKAGGSSAKSTRLWPRAVLEALDEAIAANRWEAALKIFGLLRKQHWYQPQSQTYAKLLTMLGKCGQPESASLLFQSMLSEGVKPTIDVYSSLVGAFGHGGWLDGAFHTIDEMKTISDCKPDLYTYTILINSCCKLRCFNKIPELIAEMSYLGIECSTPTYNTIIDGYGKAGMLEEVETSVSNMLESGSCLPDIYTMNSILWAYGRKGRLDKMENWYSKFQHMGIEPDVKSFNILIKSYGLAGMYGKMVNVMNFMKKRFFSPTLVTYNIMIDSFGRGGHIEKMENFFLLMKHQGMKPNSVTYTSLVSGYSKAGLLKNIPWVIRQTENSDVLLDTTFFNCVISAYGQSGDIKVMEEMFLAMKEKKCMPDKITFATMIRSYNAMGMIEQAQELETQIHKVNKENSVLDA